MDSAGRITRRITRREFCWRSLGAAATAIVGCNANPYNSPSAAGARLAARPGTPAGSVVPGLGALEVNGSVIGYMYVPASYVATTPVPLVLAFHGAGGSANGPLNLLRPYADTDNFVILAVKSRDTTWDAVRGDYGADIPVIDAALRQVFGRVAIAPQRVYVEGFSDGASYALGVGLTNGDLFHGVIAFSPGFVTGVQAQGKPKVFISHGTQDAVLDIDMASRSIVPQLRAQLYAVDYHEFVGPHTVPPEMARAAVDWLNAG